MTLYRIQATSSQEMFFNTVISRQSPQGHLFFSCLFLRGDQSSLYGREGGETF